MAELTTSTLLTKSPTALLGKTPAATPTAVAAANSFINKPKAVKAARQPLTLADPYGGYLKILLWGGTGTGKSLTIAALLELGLTVLVVSCDIGGEGLTSVRQDLRKKGKAELLENCFFFECQTYDEVEDFCANPVGFWPDIYTKDIDVLVMDGMSSFQICHVQDKVLGMDAVGKTENQSDARNAGLGTTTTDWGSVRIATIKNLNKFMIMHNAVTGKKWHKLMTCLETDKAKDNAGEIKIGPMLQGASAKLLEPCFDLIIRTVKKRVTEGEKKVTRYDYQLDGSSDRIITKSRGFEFQAVEPGDMKKLWTSACNQLGIAVGKK